MVTISTALEGWRFYNTPQLWFEEGLGNGGDTGYPVGFYAWPNS